MTSDDTLAFFDISVMISTASVVVEAAAGVFFLGGMMAGSFTSSLSLSALLSSSASSSTLSVVVVASAAVHTAVEKWPTKIGKRSKSLSPIRICIKRIHKTNCNTNSYDTNHKTKLYHMMNS